MIPPLPKKQIAALRAIAGNPGGLCSGTYPSVMALLFGMGLAEERSASRVNHPDGRAWFLTAEGRAAVKAYRMDDG